MRLDQLVDQRFGSRPIIDVEHGAATLAAGCRQVLADRSGARLAGGGTYHSGALGGQFQCDGAANAAPSHWNWPPRAPLW